MRRVLSALLLAVASTLAILPTPSPTSALEVPYPRLIAAPGTSAHGASVDVSGVWAVAGTPSPGSAAGEVTVLLQSDRYWQQNAVLTQPLSGLGRVVAIDGNVIVVGHDDGVAVWERATASDPFAHVQTVSGLGGVSSVDVRNNTIVVANATSGVIEIRNRVAGTPATYPVDQTITPAAPVTSASRVAIESEPGGQMQLAAGFPDAAGGGAVEAFVSVASVWPAVATDTFTNPDAATAGDAQFGTDVSISSAGRLVVGHAGEADGGAAWVYDGVPGAFGTPTRLTASDASAGNRFGESVDVLGDRIIVGDPEAPLAAGGGSGGAAYVFDRDEINLVWRQIDLLRALEAAVGDRLGADVAVSFDDVVLVGAPGDDDPVEGVDHGAVHPFQVGQIVAPNKYFPTTDVGRTLYGWSVSMSGTTAAVGQPDDLGRVEIVKQDASGDWVLDQEIDGPFAGSEFGFAVALEGNLLVVTSRARPAPPFPALAGVSRIDIYERADEASPFLPVQTIDSTIGLAWDVDIDGSTIMLGGNGSAAQIYRRASPTNWVLDAEFALAASTRFYISVGISGNVAVVGAQGLGGIPGVAWVYTRSGGVWNTSPTTTLTNPDVVADATVDAAFGASVDVDGPRLVIGETGESEFAPFSGAVWFYDQTDSIGEYGPPQKMKASNLDVSNGFGSAVHIDGDVVVASSLGAGNKPGDIGRTGSAHVITRRDGAWQETSFVQAIDRTARDQFFGHGVTISGSEVLVGAPLDDSELGEDAGAIYAYNTDVPVGADDPTLVITVVSPNDRVAAGATGISVRDLPPSAIEGYGGEQSNIAGTSLRTVDGSSADADPSDILIETDIDDLQLTGDLLDSILLSDIVVDGGWEVVLAGSPFDGIPLQNVSLAEVIEAGLLDGRSLSSVDLNATPIGSIPIASIALAATPIGSIPLPAGQTWCGLLGVVSPEYNCATSPPADVNNDSLVDLAIQGTPIASIPIASIPIASIPIASIPIGSIPIASIDVAGAPIGSIPIASIPIGSIPIGSIPIASIPIGSIPIGSIDVGATPIASIPIGSIPIGSIELGDLTDGGGIAASPIGSIPIGSIPIASIPIGSIPIASIPIASIPIGSIPVRDVDIGTAPIASVPIASIDLAQTPIGSIPIASIPIASIPIGSIPIASIPIASIPIGSIPIASIPIGSIPIASIDVADSPIGSIPIASIPAGTVGDVVDCSAIDCDAAFTLVDAHDAGALLGSGTLAAFEGANTGVRLTDLLGIDGLDAEAIAAQIATIGTITDVSELLTFDDMALRDFPVELPELGATVIEDLGTALDTVTLQDLVDGIGSDPAQIRAELARKQFLRLADLTDLSGMTLGDLPATDPNFAAQDIAALLPAMSGLRLGDLLALHPTFEAGDIDWNGATASDVSDWQDVTLEELAELSGTTIAELVTSLPSNVSGELTFGDLLVSLVGTSRHDWDDVRLGSLDLESTSGAQTFTSGVQVVGGIGIDRTVTVRSTLPDDAVYAGGSTVVRATDGGALPFGAGEPAIEGNQLVWSLSGVRTGVRYEIDIDVVPALSLGTSTVATEGAIAGAGVTSTAITTVGVEQAFEPNDAVGEPGIVELVSDTIYASHIGESGDVDLFSIDLAAGSRLAVSLSDLPADYDLVVYGPPVVEIAETPLRQINPTELPEVTLDGTENESGGQVLQDVPLSDLPVADVSTRRDLEAETVDIASVRTTGTYHVQVSGYSGANSPDPYALHVSVVAPPTPLACTAQNYQVLTERGSLPSAADAAGANTLILVNRERLFGKYGTDAQVALDAVDDLVTYTNTTNIGLGVRSVVVEVDGDDGVRSAFADLDAAACEPERSNRVVSEINRVIDDVRGLDSATEIDHIMIVGDDDIVPMARIADDTTIANERTYANTFLDSTASTLFGSLSSGHFLSDDPYGDLDPIRSGDRILYVTDVALGRLVERPVEIAGQIAAFVGFEGQLDPSTAFVSGYDFLTDGTEAVSDALDALPDTTVTSELINETWTAGDLIAELYPAGADSPQLASINAHFDHYRALPADQNAAGTETDLFTTVDVDLAARSGRLAGRALFSMGCHGGLSVPDEIFPGSVDGIALDWAQAFARQGAIWVGNTGFGYGETEGVELSERLMQLYAERLDGSVTAGEALFYAKQTYLGTQQAAYGPFDEKVLQQATFYGIPFFEFGVANAPAPAPIPDPPVTAPLAGGDIEFASLSVSPTFAQVVNPDEGTSFEAILPVGDEGDAGEQSTPFAQIQPTVSYDVSDVDADGPVSIAQGALITGLVTSDFDGVDPDLARPIVDDSGVEIEPVVGDVTSDPGVFVSSYLTPDGPRQSVTATLGTFRSDDADGTGTQRLFDDLELQVFYRDPADEADQVPPRFEQVVATIEPTGSGDVLVVDAVVVDNIADNVVRTMALVAVDPGVRTQWLAVELIEVEPDRWSGSAPVSSRNVEFLLQAVDGNGNTALTTNKSANFDGDTVDVPVGDIDVTFSIAPTGFITEPITLTARADGEIVDWQLDGGEIIVGDTATEVTLDPAMLTDGVHTVTFTTENGASRTEALVFDATGPVVAVAAPANGAEYDQGEDLLISFTCADAASGIVSCGATLDGAPITNETVVTPTVGAHTLIVTAIDTAGNTETVTTTFTVVGDEDDPPTPPTPEVDDAPPSISIPQISIVVETDPGASFATVVYEVTATDAVALRSSSRSTSESTTVDVEVTCTPPSGSRFSIGTTSVECSAVDAAGNRAEATFDVQVNDTELPVFSEVGNRTVTLTAGSAGPVTYEVPGATDNSGLVTVTCVPPSGSVMNVGSTTVTCSAIDASSNESSVSFVVAVEPGPGPAPDLPATGNRSLLVPQATFLVALGLVLLGVARRRSRLVATIQRPR